MHGVSTPIVETSGLSDAIAGDHMMNASTSQGAAFELRFAGLFNAGRGYVFPCDAAGHVDIDTLGESARCNYFYARSVVGREFHSPVTCAVASHPSE
jgi:hypothetical protein